MSNSKNMSWYRIPEIPFTSYVKCLKDMYKIMEKENDSKSSTDEFLKTIVTNMNELSSEDWETSERARLYQKALEGKMGDFHEELMGKIPGYETLKVGDPSGCDVRKVDDTEFFEVKNRDITMNSSSAKTVVDKLARLAALGKKAVLVEINCRNGRVVRYGAPDSVQVWNGKKTYEYLTGRNTFYNDLLETLRITFLRFKTYESLKKEIP